MKSVALHLTSLSGANVAALLLTSLLASAGCSSTEEKQVSRGDCQAVRTHHATLRAADIKMPDGVSAERAKAEREKHLQNFTRAGGNEALDRCAAERSSEGIRCALAAKTLAEFRECPS